MKFGGEFFYLDPRTLKFVFVFESNKVKRLLSTQGTTYKRYCFFKIFFLDYG